jgi:hypothetical protein
MTLQEAKNYLDTYSTNPAPCPMTYDEAFDLVNYSSGLTDEAVKVNGQKLWG